LVEQVLAEEGMRRGDCKARLLNRAYLARGEPALLVFPREVSSGEAAVDDATPGRYRLTISFVLSRGSYSTLLLKLLAQPCLRHGRTLAQPRPRDGGRSPSRSIFRVASSPLALSWATGQGGERRRSPCLPCLLAQAIARLGGRQDKATNGA
jgi:hypothetical protein